MTESQTAAGLFDLEEPTHRMALEQLQSELIAWFTTVSSKGEPHAVPVWFLWRDGKVIVLSEPDAVKLKHLRHGSPVLLHLRADRFGDQVVVLNGTAEISDRSATEWLDEIGEAYGTKYAEGMEEYGTGLEAIAEKYSTVIVVTPTKLMAW